MATLPKVIQNYTRPVTAERPVAVERQTGACDLRALPMDSVVFYCKKIDNSRLVREPDPKGGRACWNAIGAACLGVMLLGAVLAPKLTSLMDGYKLEALRSEEQQLLDERRALELQEAQLLSPDRLELLAKRHNLVTPSSDQIVHLEQRQDGAVAMVQ